MRTNHWLVIAYILQNKNNNLLGINIVGNGISTCFRVLESRGVSAGYFADAAAPAQIHKKVS
jgi:hypothetical protein